MLGRKDMDTIAYIRNHLRTAGLTVLFGITVVLLLIAKIVYGYLGDLPRLSVAVILWMLMLVSASAFGLARMTTQRAIRAIDDYRNKLEMLLYTSRDIHSEELTSVKREGSLVDRVLEAALAMTDADAAAFIATEGQGVRFAAVQGPYADKMRGLSLPSVSGIVDGALRSPNPVVVEQIPENDGYRNIVHREARMIVKSALCMPINREGKTIGVMMLAKTVTGHFTKDDEELLQFFINQSLISQKNAEYHETMRDMKLQLMNFLVEAVERLWGKNGHSQKVTQYALKIGRTLSLNEAALLQLRDAAMLHDIGLLRCDRKGYHLHSVFGHQLLGSMAFFREIAPAVLHHHERFDGAGYPAHLKGEEIPLQSRILGIAEAFDVMTSVHSFRNMKARPMNMAEAMEELRKNAGTQFDARLVNLFSDVLTEEEVLGTG